MITVKKVLICLLTIMMIFMGGCYGPQRGDQRSGEPDYRRGGVPGPGAGGIGITPGGPF